MSERSEAPGSLKVSTAVEGATVSIVLEGELDLATAPQLERAFEAARESEPKRVVVDLVSLAFIDSTGLRLLLKTDEECRQRDCLLILRPGGSVVQRVFDMTGATEVLRFEDAQAG